MTTARVIRPAREVLFCGAVLAVLVVGTTLAQRRPDAGEVVLLDAVGHLLLVTLAVVLLWRRRRPRLVFAVSVAVVTGYLGAGYAFGPVFLAVAVAAYALAAVASVLETAMAVAVAVTAWVLVEVLVDPSGAPSGNLVVLAAGLASCLVVPSWLATLHGRAHEQAMLSAERHRRAQGEQRLELAREVHDVVAHNLTVIGMQAGAALRVLDRDPERARECLTHIAGTNRQALSELRHTLDLLRGTPTADASGPVAGGGAHSGAGGGVSVAAVPTSTAAVASLVAAARAAGTTVELEVLGEPCPLGAAAERVTYRTVQEALTNAMRHAPGSPVAVDLAYGADRVQAWVRDRGPGVGGRPEGRGIRGMRERLDRAGGSLWIADRDGGGTVVRAELPVGEGPR